MQNMCACTHSRVVDSVLFYFEVAAAYDRLRPMKETRASIMQSVSRCVYIAKSTSKDLSLYFIFYRRCRRIYRKLDAERERNIR